MCIMQTTEHKLWTMTDRKYSVYFITVQCDYYYFQFFLFLIIVFSLYEKNRHLAQVSLQLRLQLSYKITGMKLWPIS